jgi:hypothetical protein
LLLVTATTRNQVNTIFFKSNKRRKEEANERENLDGICGWLGLYVVDALHR